MNGWKGGEVLSLGCDTYIFAYCESDVGFEDPGCMSEKLWDMVFESYDGW